MYANSSPSRTVVEERVGAGGGRGGVGGGGGGLTCFRYRQGLKSGEYILQQLNCNKGHQDLL